jgi:hypothetical protein
MVLARQVLMSNRYLAAVSSLQRSVLLLEQ